VAHHLPATQFGHRTKQQLLQHILDAPEMETVSEVRPNFSVVQEELEGVTDWKAEFLPHEVPLQPGTLACHPLTQAQLSGLKSSPYRSAHPQSVWLDRNIYIESCYQLTEVTFDKQNGTFS
jgi:hypothetical protein